jgi:putative flippase GtrA
MSESSAPRGAHRRGCELRRLASFAAVGVASTTAYGGLYLLLRLVLDALLANGLALLLTAVANTAANRRLTFGVRGNDGMVGDHAVGLLAFGAGLALTTGALAVLHAVAAPGRMVELVVLMTANAVATLLRFVALRLRIGTERPLPARERVPA